MEYDPSLEIEERDDVYPPSEDSILLIESLDITEGERVLEVGCGSGVVSIHCAKNGGIVTSVDINPSAAELASINFSKNGLEGNVFISDLYENVSGIFDTIVFNLPYLPVDEEGILEKSWSGGDDGMGPLPALLDGSEDYLSEKGRVVVVTSSLMDQDVLDELLSRYSVKTLGELPLFFEKLFVLEIRK
ncbi:MAG: methyltransferase [Candidatus Methanomethylophilaceae archaeon]|nr:methyltransferase [Candidatus Methanomethylophilaceae archaeon]